MQRLWQRAIYGRTLQPLVDISEFASIPGPYRETSFRKHVEYVLEKRFDAASQARTSDRLMRNWEIARGLVEERGARFVAALQPVVAVQSARPAYLERLSTEYSSLFPLTTNALRSVYPRIRASMAVHGWALDLSNMFEGVEQAVWIDGVHVTGAGNQRIAERLASRIVTLTTTPSPTPSAGRASALLGEPVSAPPEAPSMVQSSVRQ
jgi:hypothetical protein